MTMKLKRIVLLIAVCLQALSLAAAPRIVRPGVKSPTTFAIFIDSRSYEAAAAEVDAYRAAVERDGLGTYLLIDEWQNPESVRSEIIRMTEAQPHLEGVVFVGDIPIAMIRDGQHLTSAFKSSQDRDWKDSSVPSDRYYDDPELQFEFLRRDADEPLYFYYSLSPESRQHIASPIYSARIKPPKREGADSDELLRAYLRKVVKAHAEQNELDNLFVFRGHGYNSEAPEAWAGEQIALREQLPALFRTGSTVRFYDFESRWPMKPYLLEKMARKGVDVALCHHHGAPDTQYLNGYRNGSGMNVSIENIKRFLRSKIDGHKDPEKRKAELIAYYGVPEAWCQLSDSLHTADSLLDQAMDVHIEDLYNRPMNPRMVMFDACYNGSFHLDECIAASYIFGPGDCIVTQGNSVNALQDKWPDRYIGLLDCGVRIGQWGRHVHYLEPARRLRRRNADPLRGAARQRTGLHLYPRLVSVRRRAEPPFRGYPARLLQRRERTRIVGPSQLCGTSQDGDAADSLRFDADGVGGGDQTDRIGVWPYRGFLLLLSSVRIVNSGISQ